MENNDWIVPYAAGFFDGEGYVAIRKKSPRPTRNKSGFHLDYNIEVVVSNINPAPLERLKARWGGGKIQCYESKKENQRPIHRWVLTTAGAVNFLRDIQPYVCVKLPQLELALKFDAHVQELRNIRYQAGAKGTQSYSEDVSRFRHEVFCEMKRLNHRWIRTHPLTEDD